ncbi:hypothetical protein D3C80_2133630 [compost metagenome]
MAGFRREQQQIAGIAIEGIFTVEDFALPFYRQVKDVTFHAAGTVNGEIQRPVSKDRCHTGDQIGIKTVTR